MVDYPDCMRLAILLRRIARSVTLMGFIGTYMITGSAWGDA